jgi:hypothetical protein
METLIAYSEPSLSRSIKMRQNTTK